MITHDLYNPVLISPCEEGADELRITSGYATSAMASRHLEDLKKINPETKVSLLVGMCLTDGVSLGNHKGFQSLISKNFTCSYVKEQPPVHGKLYLWYKRNEIVKSFIGSANYTNNAFSSSQCEGHFYFLFFSIVFGHFSEDMMAMFGFLPIFCALAGIFVTDLPAHRTLIP